MYAALHIPRFALQARLRFRPELDGSEGGLAGAAREPAPGGRLVALVDPDESKPVVLEVTPAAERWGVQAGLPVPQALGRCPQLEILHRSVTAEAAAKDLLFHCGYSLAPRVEMQDSGLCLVDLSGAPLEATQARCVAIREELKAVGLVCRVGIAATSSLALLAAKQARSVLMIAASTPSTGSASGKVEDASAAYGGHSLVTSSRKEAVPVESNGVALHSQAEFLAELPIAAAEPGPRLTEILEKWGIRSVGAFAALPRASVGERLGSEGLQLWDRVNGQEERVVAVTKLPDVFERSWDFEYEVDTLDPLHFLLRRFLDELCLRLRIAHKVADRLSFQLRVAYGEDIERTMKAPEPTFDSEALFRLAAGRLETIESESPIVAFALSIDAAPFKQRQLGLFESSLKNPQRFAQTLARVAGIVGAERVGRPILEKEGRPDGIRMEMLPGEVEPMPANASLDHHYGMVLRRLRPPRPASVELQGRRPIWFRCEEQGGFVKACRGPWLRSGRWWESEGSWNRVEWDVELNKGGVYRLVRSEGVWFLEGMYD